MMNVNDFLTRDPYFQEKTPEEQERLREQLNADPELFRRVYEAHPLIQQMDAEQRKRSDDFYLGTPEPAPAPTPEAPMGMGTAMAKSAAAGLTQGMGATVRWVGANVLGSPDLAVVGREMKDIGRQEASEVAAAIPEENTVQKFVTDAGGAILQNLPALGVGAVFGPAAGLAFAGSQAGFSRYDEARNAGYTEAEATGLGVISGVVEAAFEKLPMDNFLAKGKTALRRMVHGVLTEGAEEMGTETTNLVTDYLVDNFYRDKQSILSDPSIKTPGQALAKVLYSGLVGGAAGMGIGAIGAVREQAMNVEAAARNKAILDVPNVEAKMEVPLPLAGDLEALLARRADEIKTVEDADRIAQEFYEDTGRRASDMASAASLQDQINTAPLDTLEPVGKETTEQPAPVGDAARTAPIWSGRQVSVGEVVGLYPNTLGMPFTQISKGPQANMPVDAVVTHVYKNGNVDLTFPQGQQLTDVNLSNIAASTTSLQSLDYTKGPDTAESAHLVRFLRKALVGDADLEKMTPEQRRVHLGGFVSVFESLRSPKDLISPFGAAYPTGHIRLLWDLATRNPDAADRIFSHEIGHILDLLDEGAAAKKGLQPLLPVRRFFAESLGVPYVSRLQQESQDPVIQRNYSRYVQATMTKFGPELMDLWRQWTLKSLRGHKSPDIRELMANALSVFLNKPAGINIGPNLQQAWDTWVKKNPSVEAALLELHGPAVSSSTILEGLNRGDAARALAEKLKKEEGLSLWERVRRDYWSVLANYVDRLTQHKVAPGTVAKLQDMFQQTQFATATDEVYIKQVMEGRFGKELEQAGLTADDATLYAMLRRVLNDRKQYQAFFLLKPGEKAEDIPKIRAALRVLAAQSAQATPDFSAMTQDEQEEAIEEIYRDLLEERVVERTVQLLSPMGLTPENAQPEMHRLQGRLGAKKWAALEDIFDRWHQQRIAYLLDPLEKSGLMDPAYVRSLKANPDYVRFSVVHHAFLRGISKQQGGGAIAKQFKQQMGTLADVANPLYETVLRDVQLAQANRWQKLRHDMLIQTAQVAPEMCREISRSADKRGRLRGPWKAHLEPGQELMLTWHWDGTGLVQRGFVIDRTLADALAPIKPGWRVPGTDYLVSWMTAYNIGFGLVNPIRDVIRSMRNLPGWKALYRLPWRMALNLPQAWRMASKGEVTPELQQLLEQGVLTPSLQGYGEGGLSARDELLVKIGRDPLEMRKVQGQLAALQMHLRRMANTAMGFIGSAVKTTEIASKASAWEYVKSLPGLTDEQRRIMVRTMAGTPNLLEKGRFTPTLTSVLLFANPAAQAIRGDFAAFQARPFEWSMKMLATQLPGKLLAIAALSGVLDQMLDAVRERDPKEETWRDWFRRIPLYQLLNYTIIPVGRLLNGDSAYLTLPADPVSQTMGGWLMLGAMAKLDPEMPVDKAFAQTFETGAGMLPQLNPMLSALFVDAPQLLQRGNIYDMFRGRDVIDRHTSNAGSIFEKGGPLLRYYLFNKGFGGPLNTILRLPYSPDTPGFKEHGEKDMLDYLSQTTGFPFASVTLGRFLRHSSQGLKERLTWGTEETSEEVSRVHLTVRDLADRADREGTYLSEQLQRFFQTADPKDAPMQAILKNPRVFQEQVDTYMRRAGGGQLDPSLQAQYRNYVNARSRDEKDRAALELVRGIMRLKGAPK